MNPNLIHRYKGYQKAAKDRELAFELTLEEFEALIAMNCYLCGEAPKLSYVSNRARASKMDNPLVYNGIDRMDNKKGYISENSYPCCSECNFSKRNLSLSDFLEYILRVYKFAIEPHEKRKDEKVY